MGSVATPMTPGLSPAYAALKTNAARLNATLEYSCQWGATPDGGMNRLSANDDDKRVRDWFVAETAKCGCVHKVDSMGNIFAIRPGQNNDLPPIGLGSHLDTQPTGGKYDGILGVLCAMEVLSTVHEARVTTYAPLAVVNWTNEEGARFPPAMLGSGVWAGQFTLEHGQTRQSVTGETMKQELERIGYLGSTPCSNTDNPLSAHFEVHIEQGTILDGAEQPVGIIRGAQSVRWYRLVVTGRAEHTGGTPMDKRSDSLLVAAQMIVNVNEVALRRNFRATVSTARSDPVSMNTIAGKVELSLDLRAPTDQDMEELESELKQAFSSISAKHGTEFSMDIVWDSRATYFDEQMVDCVRQAAISQGCEHEMMSYIGHDS
ncbi:N-carbamoyl-L-amino acid hydrolase [Cyphellophora attinorum]|uniref:N-carbamoyl-L-amino acid hydrolase n=1 Tax=Cyphellophora attinorum TaxID=1664694 RepID=A0A0N1H4A1_9EURO|nr:N-carbamoyl-L-amino acid hydrolase [Phialophora attinorum]KPI40106.1 N-carbamoyl-L-amino acid hydrolase [Phialophora attinorum]